jgi:hypothetical protein
MKIVELARYRRGEMERSGIGANRDRAAKSLSLPTFLNPRSTNLASDRLAVLGCTTLTGRLKSYPFPPWQGSVSLRAGGGGLPVNSLFWFLSCPTNATIRGGQWGYMAEKSAAGCRLWAWLRANRPCPLPWRRSFCRLATDCFRAGIQFLGESVSPLVRPGSAAFHFPHRTLPRLFDINPTAALHQRAL